MRERFSLFCFLVCSQKLHVKSNAELDIRNLDATLALPAGHTRETAVLEMH